MRIESSVLNQPLDRMTRSVPATAPTRACSERSSSSISFSLASLVVVATGDRQRYRLGVAAVVRAIRAI
jgi:hypothetical protein